MSHKPDHVFVVAEMGVNHNGDPDVARRLIDAAAAAGVDAVKTQMFQAERIASRGAQKADYQKAKTGGAESQLSMLKGLELTPSHYRALAGYAKTRGLIFFAAPFDLASIQTLVELGNPIFKIPSGEITNLPYLIEIGRLRAARVILSTGMSAPEEITAAVSVLTEQGQDPADLTLLHCNTQYPTPFEDANLRAIPALREMFDLPVGYSDHTPGIEAAIAAVALGATVIEKHFTLDRTLPGPDHQASIEPNELAAMTRAIRNIEKALGDGVKRMTRSEAPNLGVVRKSIVAARDIRRGETFTAENLTTKRPGGGVSPMRWFEALGQKAKRDFGYDELIEL
ncbi:MAG: N-acetylneuraminate synthase [Clostridiales bacterium]|jgi:N,N'-diacetyllegionaminate synthase|nr:N-acetylneuraminate synthase [Clostridiales bacterium]